MQRLLLIRHSESEWNRDGRIQGFLDCDLSELGRQQSERLRARLDLERLDVAYSSTTTRAAETARIALGHRMPVEERPDLREINLGVWEGTVATELKAQYPVETRMWFERPSKVRIDGAERLKAFRRRVSTEIDGIRERHGDAGIAIVTHGGVICTYLTRLLGLRLDDLWRFKIRNASITKIEFPMNRPRIEVLNDVSHLARTLRYVPNTDPNHPR